MHAERVEVPVDPGAKQHPARHVLPPEPHRLPDDYGLQAAMPGERSRGQAVGPGADDE